jgi:ligand-binding SRPBCC domain-containing protein
LRFEILTPLPIVMTLGARIEYVIRIHGIPVRWKTRIAAYDSEDGFTDVQEQGPYKHWHHTHAFRDVPGGTEVRDVVLYEIGLGPLGRLAHAVYVRRQLTKIFDYRANVMTQLFG